MISILHDTDVGNHRARSGHGISQNARLLAIIEEIAAVVRTAPTVVNAEAALFLLGHVKLLLAEPDRAPSRRDSASTADISTWFRTMPDLERGLLVSTLYEPRTSDRLRQLATTFATSQRRLYQLMALAELPHDIQKIIQRFSLEERRIRPLLTLETRHLSRMIGEVARRNLSRGAVQCWADACKKFDDVDPAEILERILGQEGEEFSSSQAQIRVQSGFNSGSLASTREDGGVASRNLSF
ncbi:MAG: hypothetical protein HY319_17670 [Armatimonadetes bacterium]|nr:hypothetical protein [Armatimonadota bacterium]